MEMPRCRHPICPWIRLHHVRWYGRRLPADELRSVGATAASLCRNESDQMLSPFWGGEASFLCGGCLLISSFIHIRPCRTVELGIPVARQPVSTSVRWPDSQGGGADKSAEG